MDYETSVKELKFNELKAELKPINYTIGSYDRSDNEGSNLIFMTREEMIKKKIILPDEENELTL